MSQPLEGIRVVELAEGIAGPYTGKLLADFGADVVKVEPPGGDLARRRGPFLGADADPERCALFLHLNTNKSSVVADLSTADGRALVQQLVAGADLVVESARPGTLDSLGLGYRDLARVRPGIVVVSVTSFGQSGPYAGFVGEEIVHYALGGPMSATGQASREPVKMGGEIGQYQCGGIGATAALGALRLAEQSGRSVHVDLSNVDTQVTSIDRRMTYLLNRVYTGRDVARTDGVGLGPAPYSVFPTADGYALVATMPAWVPRMLATLDDDELAVRYANPDWVQDPELPELAFASVLGWTIDRNRNDAMTQAQANGWPVTAFNRPIDVLDDPHFAARGFFVEVDHPVAGRYRQPGAPARFIDGDGWVLRRPAPVLGADTDRVVAELPGPRPEPTPSTAAPRLPLAGVRVLDMTVVWAGPYATMLLADLGAEVVRVENPWVFPTVTRSLLPRPPKEIVVSSGPIFPYPDDEPGERPWNRSGIFNAHGRNKLSATLDLRQESGRDRFLDLVEQCDLLLENNSVDLLDKLGVGWEVVHSRNPRLVMVRMPSMGIDGPYRSYLGFGTNFEALCGLTAIRGYPDLDPSMTDAVFHMDAATGGVAAFVAQAALRRRDRTGVGELVELAQADNMMNHIGELLVEAAVTGAEHGPLGNRHPRRAPQGCYRCLGEDRWAVVSVGDAAEWAGLVRAMGAPSWADDERFATLAGRVEHHDELDERIGAWTAELSDRAVFERCQAEGVPAAPVLKESDCLADPHLRARGLFAPNGHLEAGFHTYPTHCWRWDGPDLAWGPPARLGADNDYVWRQVVGLDGDGYDRLVADGHIALDYLRPDGTSY